MGNKPLAYEIFDVTLRTYPYGADTSKACAHVREFLTKQGYSLADIEAAESRVHRTNAARLAYLKAQHEADKLHAEWEALDRP